MVGTARHEPPPGGRASLRAAVVERPTAWSTRWETALDAAEHLELSRLLGRSYPATPTFTGGRSWAGARPELRVLGHQDGGVVAHAGVITRFLRAPETDAVVLVGDVGLVAVCPDRQGEGLGAALLRAVAAALARLEVPFGFLTCDPDVRPFYERAGWTAMTDRVVRSVTIDHAVEGRRHGMVLPVTRAVTAWPPGPVERNGQEI